MRKRKADANETKKSNSGRKLTNGISVIASEIAQEVSGNKKIRIAEIGGKYADLVKRCKSMWQFYEYTFRKHYTIITLLNGYMTVH